MSIAGSNSVVGWRMASLPIAALKYPDGHLEGMNWVGVASRRPSASRKLPYASLRTTSCPGLVVTPSGSFCTALADFGSRRSIYSRCTPDETTVSSSGIIYCETSKTIRALGLYSDGRTPDVIASNIRLELQHAGSNLTSIPVVFPSSMPPGVARVEATIDGKVKSVGVESPGGSFSSPPSVHFLGGGGTGASAVATIEGPVAEVEITEGGGGYISPPIVRFSGIGIHGSATAVVNNGTVTGISVSSGGYYRDSPPVVEIIPDKSLTEVVVTSGGGGYSSSPTVVICHTGRSSGASATATISASVVEVVVLSSEGGYSAEDPPEVSFVSADGRGGGATAIAVVDPETGRITSVDVLSGGSGYTSPPVVRVAGAAMLSARISGPVASVEINSAGRGFDSPPAVLFQGGGGQGASATASIASFGSGATAVATISARVVAITVTNGGSGYQESPRVRFSGGGNGLLTEAFDDLVAGRITDKEYDAHPTTPVAQCRIEGPIKEFSILSGGDRYTNYYSVFSLSLNRLSAGTNIPFFSLGEDGFGVAPWFTAHGSFISTREPYYNASRHIGAFSEIQEPVSSTVRGSQIEQACFSAADTYPGGPVSANSPPTERSGLFHQRPYISPMNGPVFYVDAVDGLRFTSLGLRKPIRFEGTAGGETTEITNFFIEGVGTGVDGESRTFSAGVGVFYERYLRAEQLEGKKVALSFLLGLRPYRNTRNASTTSLWASPTLNMSMLRFVSPPLFSVQDVAGSGATIQSTIDGDGMIASADFSSQGSEYTDRTVLVVSSFNVAKSPCAARCVVDGSGRVSHVTVDAAGGGFLSPVAVAHDGKGSGCLLRAVRSSSGDAPAGVAAIEVLSGGSGYSVESPPSVFVYDAKDVDAEMAEVFSNALLKHPVRPATGMWGFQRTPISCAAGVFKFVDHDAKVSSTFGSSTPPPFAAFPGRHVTSAWASDVYASMWGINLPKMTESFNGNQVSVPAMDVFVRIDRVRSVCHRLLASASVIHIGESPDSGYVIPLSTNPEPYVALPQLHFSGAYADEMPTLSAGFVQHDPSSLTAVEYTGAGAFGSDSGMFFAKRTA
jgi:hypothetical protein